MKMKCACCEELFLEEDLITVDIGIGPYEYWGAKGNDVRLVEASPCCEADYEEVEDAEDD